MRIIPVIARFPLFLLVVYELIYYLEVYSLFFFFVLAIYIIYDNFRRKLPSEIVDNYTLDNLTKHYGNAWLNNVNKNGLKRKQWDEVLNEYVNALKSVKTSDSRLKHK